MNFRLSSVGQALARCGSRGSAESKRPGFPALGHRLSGLLAISAIAFFAGPAEPGAVAAETVPASVVILLDSSGSMSERMPGTSHSKLTAAKGALKEVLRRMPASTHVGLLVFGGGSDTWVYPLGPRDDDRLQAGIDGLRADGGTPLGAYIKLSADRLLAERARNLGYGTYRLLIVSDGEAQDQELVNRYTPEVMARGITIDVIGVAMQRRHTLATRVHSYRAANNAEALRLALTDVLAEVGGTQKDLAEGDAFALLAPIPDELAMAALQALSRVANQPIGERSASTEAAPDPRPASPAVPSPPSPSASKPAPPNVGQGASPDLPPSTPTTTTIPLGPVPPQAIPGSWINLICTGSIALVFLAILRARRKNRRR
ncbi:MAG: VWA domain-containing protein [Verrucomicrobiales bacterium]|nr:VWA domain-containing protein [Verrucomicrobiales bacterium]